jgi:hypothetical protein
MSDVLVTLIGINYRYTLHRLYGCINDVRCMKKLLHLYAAIPIRNITTITDHSNHKPTKQYILHHITTHIHKLNIIY